MDNSTSSNSSGQGCSDETWIVFPLTYLVLYSLAISLSGIAFSISLARHSSTFCGRKIKTLLQCLRRLKQVARKFRSGDNPWSQILISAVLLCNIVYMILAMVRTYHTQVRCFSSALDYTDVIIELVITPFLILFFGVRLLASDSILYFWIKLHTLVDVVTLPNIFISLYLGQDWLLTKTLRFLWLTQVIEVLHFIPIIRSQVAIDAIGLVIRLMALWLGATGFIHLLETTGDPWRGFSNKQGTTFLEYAYFTIVTLSTVGYGDLTAATDIGRAFMTCFIIGGIAFFAFALPSLVDMVISYYHRTQWRTFDTTRVQRHVLVCGPLTANTVSDFLNRFLHKDRDDKNTHVLLMHTDRPDTKLRAVLRQHYTRTQYIVGSVLNASDLARAKIHESWEAFILARKICDSPETEDQENLLRLLSIKTTAKNIPVTIQVLLSCSKDKVKYIPHTETDTVVCLSEINLGLLAQSCICPGMSTLIGNLFYATGPVSGMVGWKSLYCQGLSQEIYATRFSQAFEGMSFYDAAKKCYESMRLILLAVEDKQSKKLYITPSPLAHPNLKIRACSTECLESAMFGYFIGENQMDVDRVSVYSDGMERSVRERTLSLSLRRPRREKKMQMQLQTFAAENPTVLNTARLKDLEEGTLHHQQSSKHILVCVIADNVSPALNLRHFLQPLRQRSKKQNEFIPVTIVSNKAYLEKEQLYISDIPGVTAVTGTCLDWDTLSRAGVDTCRACVILTAIKSDNGTDKLSSSRDKGAILCWLMLNSHFKRSRSNIVPPIMILDLSDESNVHFLYSDDMLHIHRPAAHLTKPYACGDVTVPSVFDSITASSFHSPGIAFLVQQLIACQANDHCPTRSFIHSYPLTELSTSQCPRTFQELCISMLEQHNHKTVVAISRLLLQSTEHQSAHLQCSKLISERYIVTAPSPETQLLPCDHILLLHEE